MVLETAKDRICMHKVIGKKQDEMTVEGDMIVNDVKPDILSIISTSGIACVYKKEITDGKIRMDGTINTYIIYLANDEASSIRTLNTVLDFTNVIDMENCKNGMTFNEDIKVKNIECKILNERKINIKVTLEISGTLYSDENIDIINNIQEAEDIQILNTTKNVNSVIGSGQVKTYAKDSIKIDETDDLAEIMKINTKIINKNIKISYNKVLAKADVQTDIMYLTEDNRVCKVSTNIPVMGFIDIENIDDNTKCNTDYKIKNVIVKSDANDDHSIYVEIEIEITCLAYEYKEINLIEDMYSIYSNLEFNQKQIQTNIEKNNLEDICSINKQISLPELGDNKLYTVDVIPKINTMSVKKAKITYEAELYLEFLFDSNNGMQSKKMTIPFNFELDSDLINEDDDIKTLLDVNKDNFVITSDGNLEMNVEIKFNVTLFTNETLNIIDNVSMEELRCQDVYSMIIYFVKKGDTLWKIAKKFRSTIEDIARVNGIEDVNKIYAGEQLYIPKYLKKNIA